MIKLKKTKKKYTWGFDVKHMDLSVRPQDDFFKYANGTWLKKTKIPKTEVQWGPFYSLRDTNRNKIHSIFKDILKSNVKENTDRQKLRDFYISGMNERKINKLGILPLQKGLDAINSISSIESLIKEVTELHNIGVGVLWNMSVTLDEKDSSKMALYIFQGGTGLPDKEYFSKKKNFAVIQEKYRQHIAKTLQLSGVSSKKTKKYALIVFDIEKKLAASSMNAEEMRNVVLMYNKMSLKSLNKKTDLVDWKHYMEQRGVGDTREVIVSQPNFIIKVNSLLKNISIENWKLYLRWHLVSHFSPLLSKEFVDENFSFYGKVISGLEKKKPRWQQVYSVMDQSLGEIIGKEYVDRYFSKESKKKIEDIATLIKQTYKKRLKKIDWMSTATKKRAIKKLSTFVTKIGYSNKWRDFSALSISSDSYIDNSIAGFKFQEKYEFSKLGKPVDRNEWIVDAHIVNAFYWPNQNEIIFPAGILEDPIFNPEDDIAVTFGSMGTIVGHEMTHGFDDKGSLFDDRGNMKNWWSKKDRKKFMNRADILVKQFNQYVAVDELKVNGQLTLGENIADLGGLVLGYYALKEYMKKNGRLPDIDGFSPEQRYFLGLAKLERGIRRPEYMRVATTSDPHAPAETRVNGPMSNMKEFYSAFNVKEGDALWREEEDRVKIW